MIDHDKSIGALLALLEELGIVDDTFVMYSTDNGPHCNSWPDAGTTPFRSEKNTNWEGAYRVPAMIRWPGHIKPGSVSNDIVSHLGSEEHTSELQSLMRLSYAVFCLKNKNTRSYAN